MKKALPLLILVLLFLLPACAAGGSSQSGGGAIYHKISASEAKAMMEKGNPFYLVDVRTQAEYDAERIDGAVLIPYDQIGSLAPTELPDKSALIFTYCRTGARSSVAAHTLVDMGYTNVFDIGGIQDWPYGTISG